MQKDATDLVVLGRISGVYGVKGWVRVFSHTQPRANIVQYNPWYLSTRDGGWETRRLLEGRPQGKGIVAHLEGCDDRDAAFALMERTIAVRRDQLAPVGEDEYYWADLQGMQVRNQDDVLLGTVSSLFETGAHDVLVVQGEREHLIPFVQGVIVLDVDLQTGLIRVDWEPDY